MIRKLLIVATLLCSCFKSFSQTETAPQKQLGADMMKVKFWIDNRMWTNKDLANKHNLFVMIFNPTCSHCQDQTLMLEKNLDAFKKDKLVLVMTKDMAGYFENFFNQATKVKNYPKIKIAVDSSDYVTKMTNYMGLPQLNIYDKNRKLIKMLNGDFPIDSLKPYLP